MSLRTFGRIRWSEWRASARRVGQLLSQGSLQQKVMLWTGIVGVGLSVILCLQELWRVLPAVIGVILIAYATRQSPGS
ncbi:MAG: hypothetical protein RL885_29360 [Planctomycetota bacterium]